MYRLEDYRYELPEELIAQHPVRHRDNSRLLVLERSTGNLSHLLFSRLPDLLDCSDTLVINNTKVIPGRLLGRKSTGGKAEVLILNYGDKYFRENDPETSVFDCLVKASKSPKPGTVFYFDNDLEGEVVSSKNNIHTIKFSCSSEFEKVLYKIGNPPLPPYIKRNEAHSFNDTEKYQTVYAAEKGAIAAPTAGLHFTEELLGKLKQKGINIVTITLHVGYGTFVPVRVSDIRDHKMHSESFFISGKSANAINRARAGGGRIIAVGTTSVRTLEYASDENGNISPGAGSCDLFIYPGYKFRAVDAIITNFHLPESTLIMLVSAFAGRDKILTAYKEAIKEKYRFYSYGDAMFIV